MIESSYVSKYLFFLILVEEVLNFTQVDLVPEDVMLLDTGETLFVWLGQGSSKVERNEVLVTAKGYLLSDPSERNVDIPVIVVKQGYEPPNFCGFFGAWDPDLLELDVVVSRQSRRSPCCSLYSDQS